MARESATWRAGRIALVYALIAGLWIWLSDSALELLVANRETLVRLSVAKGLFYVELEAAVSVADPSRYFLIREARPRRSAHHALVGMETERLETPYALALLRP